MFFGKGIHRKVIDLPSGVAGVRVTFPRVALPLTQDDALIVCELLYEADGGGMRWVVRGGEVLDKAGQVQPLSAATANVAEYQDPEYPDDPMKTVRATPTKAALTMVFAADCDIDIRVEVL